LASNFGGALGEDNDNNGKGMTIGGVTGNDLDDDGRRATTLTMTMMVMATARRVMTTNDDGHGASGSNGNDDGDGAMGNDNNDDEGR
jgi:hypothetical protein